MIENIFIRKKVAALFLALAMVMSCLVGIVPVGVNVESAASDFTVEEAVQWMNARATERWTVDGKGGHTECVDLIYAYYRYLGYSSPSGYARDYATKDYVLKDGWYRDQTPSPGAIIAWGANVSITDNTGYHISTGSAGHVGLVTAVNGAWVTTVETNYVTKADPSTCAKTVTGQPVNAYYIHPYFKSSVAQGSLMTSGDAAGQTIPDGDYHIVSYANSNSGVAAVDPFINSSVINDASFNKNIYLWDDMGTDNHVFTITYLNNGFYKIVHKKSGLCLDVEGASKSRGANVQLWEENGNVDGISPGSYQQWSIERDTDGSFMIRARVSGYYLDIVEARKENGTNIQM